MSEQVRDPEPGPEVLRLIREQAVGAALQQVLTGVSAAGRPAVSNTAFGGPLLTGSQVLSALMLVRELRSQTAGWESELIDAARHLGTSWANLAPALSRNQPAN